MDANAVNRASYNLIAEEYDRKYNNDDGERSLATYLKLFPPFVIKGVNILDLGCASGVNIKVEQSYEPTRIVGVDISQKMIDLANKKYGCERGVSFICSSFQEMDIPEKFDLVLALLSFVHIPQKDLDLVLQKIPGLLDDGGYFLANYFSGDDEEKEMTSTGWGNLGEIKRKFFFYREETLRESYRKNGLKTELVVKSPGKSFDRINILARKE